MLRVIIYTIFLLSIDATSRNKYTGWKLYRFWPPENIIEDLLTLQENTDNFDFWSAMREANEPVDIAVREIAHPSFENILEKLEVPNEVQIEYIDKALYRELKDMKAAPNPEKGQINFAKYHRYNVIVDYVDHLADKYKEIVKVERIGKSVEGRNIVLVKISSQTDSVKPAVLIDAALSPREWIGPTQAVYIIQELVENSSNREMIENVDWYIIPVVNPDGYEYTHTTERLWKKNRSKNGNHYGVYINKNFDINFGKELSSSEEDAWNYQGKAPFSEPETQILRKIIENNASQIKLYLSLQSFGPAILYPYAYNNEFPQNIETMKTIADTVAQQIKLETQTPYKAKHASSAYYKSSGHSVGWALEKAGIPYAYTIELNSAGYLGFDFPVHKIAGVVKEFMIGLKVFYIFIKNDFVVKPIKQQEKEEL